MVTTNGSLETQENQISKIDAIKNLLLGDDLQQIEKRTENQVILTQKKVETLESNVGQLASNVNQLEKKIDTFQTEMEAKMEAKMEALEKTMLKNFEELSAGLFKQVESNLNSFNAEFSKELAALKKDSNIEKDKLGDTLVKLGNALKN